MKVYNVGFISGKARLVLGIFSHGIEIKLRQDRDNVTGLRLVVRFNTF